MHPVTGRRWSRHTASNRGAEVRPQMEVVVSERGAVLSFHHPEQFDHLLDMEVVTVGEARDRGAVACSECFVYPGTTRYDFPYIDHEPK